MKFQLHHHSMACYEVILPDFDAGVCIYHISQTLLQKAETEETGKKIAHISKSPPFLDHDSRSDKDALSGIVENCTKCMAFRLPRDTTC